MGITKDHRKGDTMTATEELRRMLDERRVEWTANDGEHVKETCWPYMGELTAAFAEYDNGTTRFACDTWCYTTEQAIAATLGRGTCKIHDCEGSFSAVNRPVWRCDCGAFMTQYTDATTYHKPRYCPNCGRKVVTNG